VTQLYVRNFPVPEFIDPRFRENKPKRSYSVIENERFRLVFAKTGSIISGTLASAIGVSRKGRIAQLSY
jgi:hypothetical protein